LQSEGGTYRPVVLRCLSIYFHFLFAGICRIGSGFGVPTVVLHVVGRYFTGL